MQLQTKALVISSIKYGDTHLIVKCYTKEAGLKSYMLHHILKSKKGPLKKAYFLPLMPLDLHVIHKNKGTLERIKEARLLYPLKHLHQDPVKGALVLFLSDVLQQVLHEEPNVPLYEFLDYTVRFLDAATNVANIHLIFLLQLSTYLGCYPSQENKDLPYFNLQEGLFESQETPYSKKGAEVTVLKSLFGTNFDEVSALKITKKERQNTLNLLLEFYQLHLQGFKKPASLHVLQQMFS